MIILLMLLVLLALAWGLADIQLSAPIAKPEPLVPVVVKKVQAPEPPDVPQAEPDSPAESAAPAPAAEDGGRAPPVGENPQDK